MRRRELIGLTSSALLYLGCGGRDLDLSGPAGGCEPTDPDGEGPYYRAGAPQRGPRLADGLSGQRVELSGTILAAGSCRPLAGVELDLWQADSSGAYDLDGFTLRGRMRTGPDGRYRIETIKPGHYLDRGAYRPAHIHVICRAPGGLELTTQIYFAGDPYLDSEPDITSSLVARFTERGGRLTGEHDLVLG